MLDHIAIGVDGMASSLNFYDDVLGFLGIRRIIRYGGGPAGFLDRGELTDSRLYYICGSSERSRRKCFPCGGDQGQGH
ncbi:hypothetical protein VW35_19115 [Devosia soli]|uniref:Glyoxalase/fosfomycin resistance/dioxygenase domain-containing protein n=1 Tax=Devosia soli TaxID=361041 RepID=A0A0F5L0H0_9HYPH|nr:VOC family protein [Devosia soli]KKB75873.1 hypothetical protein VW35_19115 [Devosia soli]